MADRDKVAAAVAYLKRVYVNDIPSITAMAATAFAAVMDGTKVIQVSYEGGTAGSQLYFDPSLLLGACEEAIADLTAISNGSTGSSPRVITADFSHKFLST
jgi:hypothetical protein